MLTTVLSWLMSGPLEEAFKTIDTAVDNETQRQNIKSQLAQAYLTAQVSTLTGKGWWFPLLFLAPAGLWFSSVCIYSVLFCKTCMLPYAGLHYQWSVAAMPSPLDSWMGAIIGSLFIGKAGEQIIARLK